jgi:transcription elongation GreA/GreB family factor
VALKKDPTVEIPSKRNEPVRLLSKVRACDAEWFAALARERLAESIFEAVLTLEKAWDEADRAPRHMEILGERMGFGIRGAEDTEPVLAARLWLAALRMKIALPEGVEAAFLDDDARVVACLQGLPAREMTVFLAEVRSRCAATLPAVLAAAIERLPVKAVGEALGLLAADGSDAAVACLERLRAVLREQKGTSPAVACWLAENLPWVEEQRLGEPASVLLLALNALEQSAAGDQLRAQKQLREQFLDSDWLKTVFDATPELRRTELLRRIDASSGWDAAGKRSVLARLIKLYPDLGRTLAGGSTGAATAAPAAAKRFTSWRSLRERQEQFRKLKEEDIPANSREIAVARSYGDLRENFEYQSAKDLQRMLLKREAEMQEDLKSTQGTDFAQVPLDRAGMGVEVEIERPGGERRVLRILGEWDRDETLAIISSKSLVAERLSGHAVGDEVELPMEGGDERCRLAAVRALPPAVRDWARG